MRRDDNVSSDRPGDLLAHYRTLIRSVPSDQGLESAEDNQPDLSSGGIQERVDSTEAGLRRIVRDYLGDKPELHEIAREIAASGKVALETLQQGDGQALKEKPELRAGLEAIVRTDGSRPSFMIRNGEVDQATSPVGNWESTLNTSADLLNDAIPCVGRIDMPGAPQGFQGTGFLVGENLVVTNRHVLQEIAWPDDGKKWKIANGVSIDFGHEFRGRSSVTPRAVRSVAFTGSRPIPSQGIDHSYVDLALIEIEPVDQAKLPRRLLGFDAAPDWAQPALTIFTIGYPANPGLGYPFTLLEQLFQSTFGYKRLAPGLILPPAAGEQGWTLAHDATTLGGNSGSVVLVAGRETLAAGLHYGGAISEPRKNWGHVLGCLLDQTDGHSSKTLREHLKDYGVTLVDRLGPAPSP